MLDIHLFTLTQLFIRTTSGSSLGTFKQSNVLLAVGEYVIKNYFHMFKTSENSGWLRLLAANFTTTHLTNKLPLRNIISGVIENILQMRLVAVKIKTKAASWRTAFHLSSRAEDNDRLVSGGGGNLLLKNNITFRANEQRKGLNSSQNRQQRTGSALVKKYGPKVGPLDLRSAQWGSIKSNVYYHNARYEVFISSESPCLRSIVARIKEMFYTKTICFCMDDPPLWTE